jgi:hypothetical protein
VLGDSPPAAISGKRSRVRYGGEKVRNLYWIQRDLWEKRSFEIQDCFPTQEGDRWVHPPSKLRFAEDVWGKGVKESFVSKLKIAMAGRGRGGRGPRARSPEEEWDWGGG